MKIFSIILLAMVVGVCEGAIIIPWLSHNVTNTVGYYSFSGIIGALGGVGIATVSVLILKKPSAPKSRL